MEFAAYVAIGVGCLSILVGIPGIIWGLYDNKRREQQEQETASHSALTQ
jgi:hypothetical protein